MAKRFTDTSKWVNNKWFFNLKLEEKLFWLFLLDNCDSVGVWEENIELANRIIGYTYPLDTLLEAFEKQIYVFADNRKWWIRDFCNFQYGTFDENSPSKPIQSYISLLKKHSLWKEYLKGIHTLKEKEKEKEKDIDSTKLSIDSTNHELLNAIIEKLPNVCKLKLPTNEQCETLVKKYGSDKVWQILLAMENYKPLAKNNSDVYLTANNWILRDVRRVN